MKTCWEVLGIEYTNDVEVIRRTYLALLPSFHPESDPKGFKELRQAYESALQEAKTPAAPVVALDESTQQINEIVEGFRDLLASDEHRFQAEAWQRFIHKINTLSIKQVERLRWPLYTIAEDTWPVSYTCLRLLADRLGWERQDGGEAIDNETLENLLYNVRRGDLFDYSQLLTLPIEVQNRTIEFYAALEGSFFSHPSFFSHFINQHGAMVVPDDAIFQRRLLRWYSSLGWGIAELLPVAKMWREAEPGNSSPQYYEFAQRVYCGEGDTLLPELCALWKRQPSTQVGSLLLWWCRRNRPDDYPLVVMVLEKYEQRDGDGKPLPVFPGNSARTRLLWAEMLHSGELSPLSHSFVAHRLNKSAPVMGKEHNQHPRWPIYQVAECLASGKAPKASQLVPLMQRLTADDACPLEILIIDSLTVTQPDNVYEMNETTEAEAGQSGKTPGSGILHALKVIFYIFIIGGFIAKLLLLFR
ncbi:J domain-containing protein [Klebsiella oxytoca]|uniref:J domain-containing protein n=1 Tax=Klebsiella oxytoca TaxID=571 RepID=UPI00224864C1|nr:J domain-containing protein [Klebsiella oxytoca]MCW9545776.1 J domain-containing protein [Klebsiella oxytoca]